MKLAVPPVPSRSRLRVRLDGAVQGVGFRPWVYRLAHRCNLGGWVKNFSGGVWIEVEGPPDRLENFLHRLKTECPPPARIHGLETFRLEPAGRETFEIRESETQGPPSSVVLPDLATCGDCLRELRDPADRRFRYPFINCTRCGPRYSIIHRLPYDRPNTSMREFSLCAACRAEYESPDHRRFHAQPNACPDCGPQLEWWDGKGRVESRGEEALQRAEALLLEGAVVAVKGLGGFHLVCDATCPDAVQKLRQRKQRPARPLALLFPSLEQVRRHCELSAKEQALLTSPCAPIVLLRVRQRGPVAEAVAPGYPVWGVMLPANPLHHLLAGDLNRPLVATSGNRKDETLCYDERDAVRVLEGLADGFLVHNRPILRHVDDSIYQVVAEEPQVLRRARGLAPLPLNTPGLRRGTLAVGGHLKNSVALGLGGQTVLGQHIGDLETPRSRQAMQQNVRDLSRLFGETPQRVVADAHPDYASSGFAESLKLPLERIQHHVAHVLACREEHQVEGPALGIAWDGAGWGPDGTLWGGEFFLLQPKRVRRLARLRPFPLPGGEAALREPRRAALGLLFAHGDGHALDGKIYDPLHQVFTEKERSLLLQMLTRNLQCPQTSSLGRLFDALASLLGVLQVNSYEGEAAVRLEFAAGGGAETRYRLKWNFDARPWTLDWAPLLEALLKDRRAGVPVSVCAGAFHRALAEAVGRIAERVGDVPVLLAGGCFQNRLLTEEILRRLRAGGHRVFLPRQVPPNDGGLALGQLAAAGWTLEVD